MASADIQAVKRRIKSVSTMEHVTNAMKLVSAAKLRRAKATFERTHEHFMYLTHSIAEVFNNAEEVPELYLEGSREIKNTCYIVITGTKGLCGSFNTNVIKEAEREIMKNDSHPMIVAIGTKGRDYFAKRDFEMVESYISPAETISFLDSQKMSKPILTMFNEGEIDEVILVYTSFISTLTQEVKTVRLLPFDIQSDPDIIKHDKPVEYEPTVEDVFNYMVPKFVEITLYGAIVESATCEHAARRTAMENAAENANEMLGELSLYYNRARQEAITNELIEIVAGSEAQQST